MRFYNISENYITFLREFDSKIALNKGESRPYVGVVLRIDDVQYFAPLTSPKPKHENMKNGKDFHKINQGKLGAINLNNMIPVINDALIPINFDELEDTKYRELLRRQYRAVRSDETKIMSKAFMLRELVLSNNGLLSKHDLVIKSRCCNFQLLEEVYTHYIASETGSS